MSKPTKESLEGENQRLREIVGQLLILEEKGQLATVCCTISGDDIFKPHVVITAPGMDEVAMVAKLLDVFRDYFRTLAMLAVVMGTAQFKIADITDALTGEKLDDKKTEPKL